MKNKTILKILIILSFIFSNVLFADNILIESKNIIIDKNKDTSIFEDQVIVKTEDKNEITSDYAEYDKKTGLIILKQNIVAIDNQNNTIETNYAEYNEKEKIFKSVGPTKITTSEKYVIEGKDVIFDNNKNFIKSNQNTLVTDKDKNKIYLDNFEYYTVNKIFKSIGFIKVKDINSNSYEFSQLYIDTLKKEMLEFK